ncbi:MAG: MoxR family ATPase [Thermoguttaceae bacterium]|jgi:MoxR-like ATPase|nr:MoxR family ATPase [Thermoguttaceae bacterium]
MSFDIQSINIQVSQQAEKLTLLRQEIGKVLIGQKTMVDRLLIGLLTGGHILLEGVPGLAKTTAIKALAQALDSKFQRIQFTPDLLPADLLGTMIYVPGTGDFQTRKGPIFSNFILADEINRAPSKVQSALLEAMQEKQVTIGDSTYKLDDLFLVMATQNPIEQEGTYPLPEAQLDRFMLKVKITYPKPDEEMQVLNQALGAVAPTTSPVLSEADILSMKKTVEQLYIDDQIKRYILSIVQATRNPEDYDLKKLKPLIEYGGSPRATIYLAIAARAEAFLNGRGFVTPQDVKDIAYDVLRHRIIPTYEAEAEGLTSENIIDAVLQAVPVP